MPADSKIDEPKLSHPAAGEGNVTALEPPTAAEPHPPCPTQPTAGKPPPPDSDPEVDPELLDLPRRQRRRRHPLISVLVIGLSLYLMYFVREDFAFFFQPRRAVDMGEAGEALRQSRLKPNTYVELSGAPDRKHALILEARLGGYNSFFRLLQTSNQIFIQHHRETRSTDEVVSGRYRGQLVRFASLPYFANLSTFFEKTMTLAHDLDFGQLERAKVQKNRVVRLQDQNGVTLELNPDSLIWINVAYPNEWLIQFSKRFYAKIEATQKPLADLKLPVAVEEESSATFWRFVVHATPSQVPMLMARFQNPELHANVVRRQVSYSARWDQLSVEGKNLLINAADSTFPSHYRAQAADTPSAVAGTLIPVKESLTRVPAEAILYLTTSSPFKIPPQAMVLLTAKAPSDNWYYVLLYVVLLGFIIVNSVTLVHRWREFAAKRA